MSSTCRTPRRSPCSTTRRQRGSDDTAYPVAIDGLQVTGGAQSDFPGNVNVLTGGIKTPYGATGALVTQGGGIYLHNNNRSARITDNVIVGNSGSYGGGIRVGTPYTGDNRNYDTVIADNQVLNNGGTNLAGGIGLFTGSDGYKVQHNAICGNFSAEYGGAMTAFGYQANPGGSTGGTISGNTVWFNSSYDEGGAIMLAGELPADADRAQPRHRAGDRRQQRHRRQHRERRRRRHPPPPGERLARHEERPAVDHDHEQHRDQQRLGPRGWRRRPRRRAVREVRQQHRRRQHDDGDRGHLRRAARTSGPVDRAEQRPAHGPAETAPLQLRADGQATFSNPSC